MAVTSHMSFHTVHGVLRERIPKWFAIPFSSGPHFVRTLHHDLSILGGLHGVAHSFIDLDKAVSVQESPAEVWVNSGLL